MTPSNPIVSRQDFLAAHAAHLDEEKRVTRLRDEIVAKRRDLPWYRVEKTYTFDTPAGPRTLADLFGDKTQLIVQHFMFGPGWAEGCVGCSFEADHVDGALKHLPHRDAAYVAVSRAPLAEIQPFKRRMGWQFDWVSSHGTTFNHDFHVTATDPERAAGRMYYNYAVRDVGAMDEMPGHSVFFKDAHGHVYHTYSAFGRGLEQLIGTYVLLDLLPKGRDETGPRRNLTDWVRHHDRYGATGAVDGTGRFRPESPITLTATTAPATTAKCGCTPEPAGARS